MTKFTEPFKVRDGLWGEETKVGTIEKTRHTVIFPGRDGEETTVTFCNNCGSAILSNGLCTRCGYEA